MFVSVLQQHQPSPNPNIPFHIQATNSRLLKRKRAQEGGKTKSLSDTQQNSTHELKFCILAKKR